MIQLLLLTALIVSALSGNAASNTAQVSNELQAKLDRYQKDLQLLQQQVQKLKQELQSNQGQTSLSISKLQEGLANERDILNTVEGYLSLPFNLSRCECYDLSPTERVKVEREIKTIKQQLTSLELSSTLAQSCPQGVEIHKELLRERRYILSIEQALTSKTCGQRPHRQVKVQVTSGLVDLAQSEYQTNLRAKNWCYGKLTEQQVKLLWFAYTVKNNVTNCPIQTPFFDGEKCFDCQAPTAFFDLSLRKCVDAQSVNSERKCIGVGSSTRKNQTETTQVDEGPTYKDVTVTPLEADPIVKSVTYNKEKKTVDKIVQPIEGKAVLDKQKTTTNINYVEVEPEVADPQVKIRRVRRTSSSSQSYSSRSRSSSSQASGNSGRSSSSGSSRSFQTSSNSHYLQQF